jgi:hypothetical protein
MEVHFKEQYFVSKHSLEMHYLDDSLNISILQEYITDMVKELKRENVFLSLNEIIKILRLDNYCLQKLSISFIKFLLSEEVINHVS